MRRNDAQPADVNHLAPSADFLHEIPRAAFAHESLVGRDLAPHADVAHPIPLDEHRIHRDHGDAALLQLPHRLFQRIDLHGLKATKIPVAIDHQVELVALLLRIELTVEPHDLDPQKIAPQLGRILA